MLNPLKKTVVSIAVAGALLAAGGQTVALAQPDASPQLGAMTLQHVAIRVTDFEGTVAWYKEKFGAEKQIRWDAPPYIDPELSSLT